MRRMRLLGLGLAVMLLFPCVARAEYGEAYQALTDARAATHQNGPFKMRGEAQAVAVETTAGKVKTTPTQYHLTGYDLRANETLLQFETRHAAYSTYISFLLKPDAIYVKEKADWQSADITTLLSQLIAMGVADQFFLLEIVNSPRLEMYADYMTFGEGKTIGGEDCRAVKVAVSKTDFTALAEKLTEDVAALLGEAAANMSEKQLAMVKLFTKGIFTGLDAAGEFVFYIQPSTGYIVQIETRMDMANPYGSRLPGANPRVKSQGRWYLYDMGAEITAARPR